MGSELTRKSAAGANRKTLSPTNHPKALASFEAAASEPSQTDCPPICPTEGSVEAVPANRGDLTQSRVRQFVWPRSR